MIKYYCGYTSTFGKPSFTLWVEDDGVAVGGAVNTIAGNRHEITHKEFTYTARFVLQENYPYKEPKDD